MSTLRRSVLESKLKRSDPEGMKQGVMK